MKKKKKNMLEFCGLPSYPEAFFVDSILVSHRVNIEYTMLNHMIACCLCTMWVFPYRRFMMKVFKEFGIDLSSEIDDKKAFVFKTCNQSSMGRMKFVRSDDGE